MKLSDRIKEVARLQKIPESKLSGLKEIDSNFEKYGGVVKIVGRKDRFGDLRCKSLLVYHDSPEYNSITAVYHSTWS